MSIALTVIALVLIASTTIGLVVLGLQRRRPEPEVEIDRAVLEERLAWLEEHYGVDHHKVFVEGTAIVVDTPEQHRPVQRG